MTRQLLIITLSTLILASCSKTDGNHSKPLSDFATHEYLIDDSLILNPQCKGYYKAQIDIPVEGSEAVIDSVRLWMAKEIIGSQNPDSASLIKMALDGNLEEVLFARSSSFLKNFKTDAEEMEIDDSDPSMTYFFEMSSDYSIKEIFKNDNFVTFVNEGYEYLGGAHGMPWRYGQTFYRTGKPLGWDLLALTPQNQSHLRDLIAKGLLDDYFKTNKWETTGLWVADNIKELPLPTIPPYLMEEGIEFIYGPYEIGPYAIGQPNCVIPLSQLNDLLNPLYFPDRN